MIELFSDFIFFRFSQMRLIASISSPESISSIKIYSGFNKFIWSISSFLFSHQLNQTFKSLSKIFSSSFKISKYFLINLENNNGERGLTSDLLCIK
jgi:hypothetical protein